MPSSYSQVKAMLAISRASLKAIFKSPQAVFFSLFFPIVLIMIFGAMTGSRSFSMDVAFDKETDTTSELYHILKGYSVLNVENASEAELLDRLKKGRITAIFEIRKRTTPMGDTQYDLHIKTSSASQRDLPV